MPDGGSGTGTFTVAGTTQTNLSDIYVGGPPGQCGRGGTVGYGWTASLTVTPGNVTFDAESRSEMLVYRLAFAGTLANNQIIGSVVRTTSGEVTSEGRTSQMSGLANFNVTLRLGQVRVRSVQAGEGACGPAS